MKQLMYVLVLVIGFAIGWYSRPQLDKEHIAVIADDQVQVVNNPQPGTGWVLYKGIDSKMHWGFVKLPNTDGLPRGDQRIPEEQFTDGQPTFHNNSTGQQPSYTNAPPGQPKGSNNTTDAQPSGTNTPPAK